MILGIGKEHYTRLFLLIKWMIAPSNVAISFVHMHTFLETHCSICHIDYRAPPASHSLNSQV